MQTAYGSEVSVRVVRVHSRPLVPCSTTIARLACVYKNGQDQKKSCSISLSYLHYRIYTECTLHNRPQAWVEGERIKKKRELRTRKKVTNTFVLTYQVQ